MTDETGAAPPRDEPGEMVSPAGMPLAPMVVDDEAIPVIDAEMLHQDRIDLETGMKVVPPVTLFLIAACLMVYVRQVMLDGLANVGRVIETGAVHRPEVLNGEVWRLISGGFMHASSDHLIGNMVMLFILGMACEHAFGCKGFLFLYVTACAFGSLLTLTSTVPTVGASGAIFGLAGALIALTIVHRRRIEIRDHRVGIVLGVWSIYTLALGLLSPIVSNTCHLGGLIGGSVLGALLPPALLTDRVTLARQPGTRLQGALALAVLVLTAYFFLPHLG